MGFEVKKTEKLGIYKLIIDGVEAKDSFISPMGAVEIADTEFSQKLINLTFKEIFLAFNEFVLLQTLYLSPLIKLESKININTKFKFDFDIEKHRCRIHFYIQPDIERWDNPFTFFKYKKIFVDEVTPENVLRELEFYPNFRYEDLPLFLQTEQRIEFEEDFDAGNNSIADTINKFINAIKEIDLRVFKSLLQNHSLKTITTSFNFPEEIKASCEQYLLYFATFLRDLGINVNSILKEEAGKVLFSVTPADEVEALDKIREALALYLSLPSSPVVFDESFKAMRLEQQIRNLEHSQRMAETEIRSTQYALRLAQQNIENQDRIIARQDSLLEQQNRIIEKITSKSVMIDSLENKEEIFEGLKVGESEFLAKQVGVHFNPITSLKTLGKKILGKEEIISILDSDEETDKK